ncbi:YheC/YheD family protein [Ammoniphilus sp. CFH 90114]|uniref:YheC/YheD family endospore coat-associated protein n=1 Tax=Ammoniphilus sp. CFH 90114 TaxID=2493665 RepID=UPI0013E95BDE|nr:YheC/YheD family protein [Ammoniphilus sp. CFH 90114]
MKKDWLGILVNDGLWEDIPRDQTGHENIDYYYESGQRYDLTPCFFRLRDVSLRNGQVNVLVKSEGRWKQHHIKIPRVVHNRAIFQSPLGYTYCKKLAEKGVSLFNFWNRYSKVEIAEILSLHKSLIQYLPMSDRFSLSQLAKMGQQYPSIMLKPDKGTVGEGIIKVDRITPLLWNVKYRSGRQLADHMVATGELYPSLKRLVGNRAYFLQETIRLATYKGSPFDIRVSIQKDGKGKWGVTGMIGKAARPGHFLSNVAQGGTVYRLEELLQEYPDLILGEVSDKLEELALNIVHALEKKLPHLADVGFDFGIDRLGHPYFIEMNGRDQRYSFAKGNMLDTWKLTYEKPVAYARYLLEKRKERVQ